jgi:hypothetical protein
MYPVKVIGFISTKFSCSNNSEKKIASGSCLAFGPHFSALFTIKFRSPPSMSEGILEDPSPQCFAIMVVDLGGDHRDVEKIDIPVKSSENKVACKQCVSFALLTRWNLFFQFLTTLESPIELTHSKDQYGNIFLRVILHTVFNIMVS